MEVVKNFVRLLDRPERPFDFALGAGRRLPLVR